MRESTVSAKVSAMPLATLELGASRPGSLSMGGAAPLTEILRDPRRAITEQEIVCLVCGAAFRHLTNISPATISPRGTTSAGSATTPGAP